MQEDLENRTVTLMVSSLKSYSSSADAWPHASITDDATAACVNFLKRKAKASI